MKNVFVPIFVSVFLFLVADSQAQNAKKYTRPIWGKVTLNHSKIPLEGVTVKVRGMAFDTITNTQGEFEFDIPKYYITLIFKKIGFKSQEIKLRDLSQENFEISLQIDKQQTGWESEIRLQSLRNPAKNSADWEQNFPVGTFQNALSGQFLGVQNTANQGVINPSFQTQIRGISSITNTTQPLYVIDGMPIFSDAMLTQSSNLLSFNPLADISIHEIDQIFVLKDAAATALYGARGANGVILIKTKTGKKTGIQASYYAGINSQSIQPNLLNFSQFSELYRQAYAHENQPQTTPFDLDSAHLQNTNWMDEITQLGILQNFNISTQKHTKSGSYYAFLNYRNEQNYLKRDNLERLNFRWNAMQQFSKKLYFGVNSVFMLSSVLHFPKGLEMAQQTPSIFAPQDSFGNYILPLQNPVYALQQNDYQQHTAQFIGNIFAEYQFNADIKWRNEIGTQQLWSNTQFYQSHPSLSNSQSSKSTISIQNINFNSYFTWRKALDWHDIQILTGMNLQNIHQNESENTGIGFDNPAQKSPDFAQNQFVSHSLSIQNKYLSYFTDIQYIFNGTYSVGATIRADGSNRTGANQRGGYYPTLSAGWNIFERDTLSKGKLISFLKVRGSHGFTANSNFLGQNQLKIYEGQANYGGQFGIRPTENLGNQNLRPELVRQTDFSLLFGLFDQKVHGEINYFYRKSTNLILPYQLSYLTGYEIIMENTTNTKFTNSGLEIGLNARADFTENFAWKTTLNLTLSRNKIHRLAGQQIEVERFDEFDLNSYFIENQPINVWKLAKWAGINDQTGLPEIRTASQINLVATPENITENLQITGNPNPTYFGGFQHHFLYNQLTMSFLFTFAGGHQIYKVDDILLKENFGKLTQKSTDLLNYWSLENVQSDIPVIDLSENQYVMTDRYLYDADFLRLKSVQVSYDFEFTKLIKSLTIFANLQNLFLWTKFPADPEVHVAGFQYFHAPQSRSFVVGCQMNF